jgi:hypothetical protein
MKFVNCDIVLNLQTIVSVEYWEFLFNHELVRFVQAQSTNGDE